MTDPAAVLEPVFIVWLTLMGATVGSFLNVCIFRMPRRCLSVLRPKRSFCPRCRHAIRWHENIPIASWVLLRGRCAGCALPISARYPAIEALTAGLFLYLAWVHVPGRLLDPEMWAVLGIQAVLGSALIVCTFTDLDFRIIPDEIDVPGLLLAPVLVALVPAVFASPPPDLAGLGAWSYEVLESPLQWWGVPALADPLAGLAALPERSPELYPHARAFAGAIFGAVSGAGFIWLSGELFTRLLDLPAMGFGDVKYMGMIGGFAGWQGVVLTFLVAFLSGSVAGVLYMAWSGRPELRGRDLTREDLTPLNRLAIWLTGARSRAGEAGPDEVIPIRPGTRLFARFATGDSYIPFGPFLSLGAAVAILAPGGAVGILAHL